MIPQNSEHVPQQAGDSPFAGQAAGHTPGPWTLRGPAYGRDDIEGDFAIVAEGRYIIAETYRKVAHDRYEPSEANAHLIAAAPDLLAALHEVARLYGTDASRDDPHAALDRAYSICRTAIAKAEGAAR